MIDVPIAETIVHENYVSSAHHDDIALIRLAYNVSYSDYVKPICLPFRSNVRSKNFDDSPLVVSGYGRTERGMYSV